MKTIPFLIGTYTFHTGSEGIYACSLNPDTGRLTQPRAVASPDNPSYIIRSADGQRLYSVCEGYTDAGPVPGSVVSFRLENGEWVETGRLSSGGCAPCHLAVDEARGLLATANYLDGVMTLCRLDETGALSEVVAGFPGPEGCESHAHMCLFFDGMLWCADLGADRIRRYAEIGGTWKETAPILLPSGCGPRHMAVHPAGDTVYVGCEVSSHLYTLQKHGDWEIVQDFCCIPEGTESYVGAVRIHDDRLYVSNRGHESVSVFSLDAATHLFAEDCRIPCPAAYPRDLMVAGDCVLCACQKDNAVVVMQKQPDGSYAESDRLTLPMPVCLLAR